ncbi:DEKNAAC103680 [Brettanomyces naardenensis]|uniref:RNA exonuclease 4 n=1 Tax=Brettanomyces naardenensis TaxID=13370 RepID=A0A448YNB0_BRENA|nr:DEKNAAC103680 [Brettanomyces naardenensis]
MELSRNWKVLKAQNQGSGVKPISLADGELKEEARQTKRHRQRNRRKRNKENVRQGSRQTGGSTSSSGHQEKRSRRSESVNKATITPKGVLDGVPSGSDVQKRIDPDSFDAQLDADEFMHEFVDGLVQKSMRRSNGRSSPQVALEPDTNSQVSVQGSTKRLLRRPVEDSETEILSFLQRPMPVRITESFPLRFSSLPPPLPNPNSTNVGKFAAMDCEFVGIGPNGTRSELARVSIVNFNGFTILDEYVMPYHKVTNWRTWVSGITPDCMTNAIQFDEARERVVGILKGKILVGHAVYHDLQSLHLKHPYNSIRDTANHIPYKEAFADGKTPSLRLLAKKLLNLDIQGGEHSSVEDAKATMMVYRCDRDEFERRATGRR